MQSAPQFALDQEPPLTEVVRARALHRPTGVLCVEVDGGILDYGTAWALAESWARSLTLHGVGDGDLVLTMLRPSATGVTSWLGAGRIGAVDAAVNTEFRGRMLQYVIEDSGARVAVVEAEYLPRLTELDALGALELVIVVGETPDADPVTLACPTTSLTDFLDAGRDTPMPSHQVRREDPACLIYTSGTTGPSKGVLVTWGQLAATLPAQWTTGAGTAESYYMPFPMYHVVARTAVVQMARHGGRVVLRRSFSVEAYWNDIREHLCTFSLMAGGVPNFLLSRPRREDDADNPLRKVVMAPVIGAHEEFAERFGVEIVTGYNMTEISLPFYFPDGIADPRSCGRLREGYPHYEVRLVDAEGCDVPEGESGELLVRTGVPGTLNAGYHGKPEATAEAWRDGWFHTGDAFRRDEDGHYYFVDRIKDAIRRRGENISSFEVEALVMEHPDVVECAAVGVPSEVGEDEVQVWVVPAAEAQLDPRELIEFLIPRMPRFMLPRYVRVADELPKTTATQRVQKHLLRDQTDRGYDRTLATR